MCTYILRIYACTHHTRFGTHRCAENLMNYLRGYPSTFCKQAVCESVEAIWEEACPVCLSRERYEMEKKYLERSMREGW